MKLSLFFVVSCLVLHNGEGTPRTAVYRFVRCNPDGDQANCVTLQTPQLQWTPELPSKLPASAARHLEAEPVEGESPERQDDYYEKEEEEDTPMNSEDGESPPKFDEAEGSGNEEGSAAQPLFLADWAGEGDTGSGESWEDEVNSKDEKGGTMKRLFPSIGEDKPSEKDLQEDHLLSL